MGFIYMITSPSGRHYVGQTTMSLDERMRHHQRPESGCTILSASIRKYGWASFVVQVLQECSNEELNDLERLYIKKFDCLAPMGMNCTTGGDSGQKYCKETRLKISDSGRKDTLGHIKALPSGRFDAKIGIMRSHYHVGRFDSREEAQIGIDSFYAKYDPHYTDERPERKHARSGSGSVNYDKRRGKYAASIQYNGRPYFCGQHSTEKEAQDALIEFNNAFDPENPPQRKQARPGTGCVSFDKNSRKYLALITLNGRQHYCGSHLTEEEGRTALARFKDEYDPETLPPPSPKRASRGMGSVTQNKKSGKYLANIRKNGKNYFCGSHDTEEAARWALARFKDEFDPENIQQQKNRAKNGAGSVYKSRGKYLAQIQCNGQNHHCGSHATEAAANEALETFKASLSGDPPTAPNVAND